MTPARAADLDLARRINDCVPKIRGTVTWITKTDVVDRDDAARLKELVWLLEEAAGRLMLRSQANP